MSKKYFIVDTETGGLPNTVPTPSLLTLYGIIADNELNVLDEIHLKIRPQNGLYIVDKNALAINNINIIEHDKTAIDYVDAADELYQFILQYKKPETTIVPMGQNIHFDLSFIKPLLNGTSNQNFLLPKLNSFDYLFSRRVFDLPSAVYYLIMAGKLPEDLEPSLMNLAKHFGLSYNGAHNEKFDVELLVSVLRKLLQLIGE